MGTTLRTIAPDEITPFRYALIRAFGGDPDADDDRGDERVLRTADLERTYAAFDGDAIVGTASTFALELAVPGGAAPMGGFTMASVSPTHRRRGILRDMMEAHLAGVRSRGEPLSGLWASEAPIYGRFGYGVAAEGEQLACARVEIPGDDGDRMRLVSGADAAAILPGLYERLAATRPGTFARSNAWWELRCLDDPPSRRGGASSRRHGVAFRGGDPVGYVAYRQRSKWEGAVSEGTVEIVELLAADPRAERTLWRFVSHIDLFPRVTWWNAPVDAPLPWLASDRRRIARTRTDTLWLRLCDVPAALEARAYRGSGALRIAVEDPGAPDVEGLYELRVEDGAGACAASAGSADLHLDASALASVYLGGASPSALARAGRVTGSPDAVARADQLLSWPTAPWCPEIF